MFRRLAVLAAIVTLAVLAMVPVSTATAGGTKDRPLTIERDFLAETGSMLLGGDVFGYPLARFFLRTGSEDVRIDTLVFRIVGSEHISELRIYSGAILMQRVSVGSASSQVIFVHLGGALPIPAGSFRTIAVTGSTSRIASPLDNDTPVEVSLVAAMGITQSQQPVWDIHTVPGPTHRYFGSYPAFSVNASSPSGTLIPASNTLLAIFDVTAVGSGAVTFSSGDKIVLNISQSINDSNGTLNAFELRDYDTGTSLDTTAIGGAGTEVQSTTVTFDFTAADLIVPAGQTKRVAVYSNTQELEDEGDTIQVWLDDSYPGNLAWSVNGIGPYNRADIILRGDVYAGALQKH